MSDDAPAGALGPLPLWAVAAVVGALAGWAWAPPPGTAVSACAAGVGLAVVAWRRGSWSVAALAVAVTLAGAAAVRVELQRGGPLDTLARDGGAAEVAAKVVTEPRRAGDGWWTVVRLRQVGPWSSRERALLRGDGTPPVLGSRWAGTATARPLGTTPFDAHLARLHVVARLDPRGWRRAAGPSLVGRTSEWARGRVRAAAATALPAGPAGLAAGLVTGDTRLLPEADEQAMRDAGLTHLTAVSGSNVAIAIGAVLAACGLLAIGARGRRRAVAGALVAFAYLTRFEPSVLRATVMAGLVLLAASRGAARDPRHALGAAVLVLVAVDPALAGSLGLLLSSVATAGVLVVAPALRPRLERLPRRAADLLAITLGAQVAVAPVLLVADGVVPLASIPANLIAVPAAGVASVVAGVGALVALVSVPVAGAVMGLARPVLALILGVAHAARGRGGAIAIGRPLTVLAAVAVLAWLLTRRPGRLRRVSAATAVLAVVVLGLPRLHHLAPVRTLTVTAIDVGQGDAVLVESPHARVLVDGGGDDRAARWLRSHRRRDLDLVVVSHPHADHVDGLPAVVDQGRVGAVWYRAVPTELDSVARLLQTTATRRVPVHAPSVGQTATVGDLLLEVLGPPPGRPYRGADSEANETSLVLRASWRGRAVLLTGDAELEAQATLLARPGRLRAGVLKVPHHGAGTTVPAFLTAPGASVALISVGPDNRYGHPHPRTLETLHRAGVEVRRTDLEGTVRVEVPPSGAEAHRTAAVASGSPGAWVGSRHVHPRVPARRRRRPPAAPRAGAAAGASARRRPRARRRDLRRPGDRAPPGAAHPVAVRGPPVRGAPRRRDAGR